MTQQADIRGFHAHVYFDSGTRRAAERVRDALARELGVEPGALRDQPVGPHPKAMFQVTLTPGQFAIVVPWLMVNRSGLSVLVHPTTDDAVADHDTSPLWMGEPLAIDVEFIRHHVARLGRRRADARSAWASVAIPEPGVLAAAGPHRVGGGGL